MGVGISCKNGLNLNLSDLITNYTTSKLESKINKNLKGSKSDTSLFTKVSTKNVISKQIVPLNLNKKKKTLEELDKACQVLEEHFGIDIDDNQQVKSISNDSQNQSITDDEQDFKIDEHTNKSISLNINLNKDNEILKKNLFNSSLEEKDEKNLKVIEKVNSIDEKKNEEVKIKHRSTVKVQMNNLNFKDFSKKSSSKNNLKSNLKKVNQKMKSRKLDNIDEIDNEDFSVDNLEIENNKEKFLNELIEKAKIKHYKTESLMNEYIVKKQKLYILKRSYSSDYILDIPSSITMNIDKFLFYSENDLNKSIKLTSLTNSKYEEKINNSNKRFEEKNLLKFIPNSNIAFANNFLTFNESKLLKQNKTSTHQVTKTKKSFVENWLFNNKENKFLENHLENRSCDQECKLCIQSEDQMNELENDVLQFVYVLSTLEKILHEKERKLEKLLSKSELCKIYKQKNNEKITKIDIQRKIKMLKQRTKKLGVSFCESENGKQQIVFRDGKSTYHIEIFFSPGTGFASKLKQYLSNIQRKLRSVMSISQENAANTESDQQQSNLFSNQNCSGDSKDHSINWAKTNYEPKAKTKSENFAKQAIAAALTLCTDSASSEDELALSVENSTSKTISPNLRTRKCQSAVIQVDGRSFMIVANPSETNSNEPTTSNTNNNIVVRKAQPKPLSELISSSIDQQEPSGSSETKDEKNLVHRSKMISSTDSIHPVDTLQACDKAANRLKELLRHIDHGQVSAEVVKKTLQYAVCVLDTVTMDETRPFESKNSNLFKNDSNNNRTSHNIKSNKLANIGRASSEIPTSSTSKLLASHKITTISPKISISTIKSHDLKSPLPCTQKTEQSLKTTNVFHANQLDETINRRILDEEDDLSEVQPDAVPNEVREWLATTFTRQSNAQKRKLEDKPKFRTVANAIRAGILVNRLYMKQCGTSVIQIPSNIIENMKCIDNWSFDCFQLNQKAPNQALKYITCELLNRYGLTSKFRIPQSNLDNFIYQIEQGYLKYKNPYHNNMHAADVTQTVHYMLSQLGLMNWLSDLEILATLYAAIIHDYQHTGTTNNFHVMSGSEIALLYNDRAVLENYHLSSAFQVLRKEECNIAVNLNSDDYRDFRNLVIEMVLATDMNSHFLQLKTIKTLLSLPNTNLNEEKTKVLSLILHCCDISHPAKDWDLHSQWTGLLMEEFFQQGDKEHELGLSYSPLCDRNATVIPDSQIGFINYIVSPSLDICGDLLDKVQQSIRSIVNSDSLSSADQNNSTGKLDEIEKRPKSSKQFTSESSFETGNLSRDASSAHCKTPSFDQLDLIFHSNNIGKDGRIFRPWDSILEKNKSNWLRKAAEDLKKREQEKQDSKDKSETN